MTERWRSEMEEEEEEGSRRPSEGRTEVKAGRQPQFSVCVWWEVRPTSPPPPSLHGDNTRGHGMVPGGGVEEGVCFLFSDLGGPPPPALPADEG